MQSLARSARLGVASRLRLHSTATGATQGAQGMDAKAMLHRAFGYLLTGLTLYMTHEALEDAVLYRLCTTMAINAAETNEELRELLGSPPYTAGPWWNSSLRTSFGSKIVTSQFPLKGEKAATDVRVGLVRHGRSEEHWTDFSNVLFVVIGPNAWRPLFVDATVPQRGGEDGGGGGGGAGGGAGGAGTGGALPGRPKRISLVPVGGGAGGAGTGGALPGRPKRISLVPLTDVRHQPGPGGHHVPLRQ